MQRQRALIGLLILSGLFIASLVTCNLIATKFTELDLGFKVFVVSVGILPYPLTFLITDVISEIYGRRRANQIVFSGFVASLLVWLCGSVASLKLYLVFANRRIDSLPEGHPHRPRRLNDAWENEEIKDILAFLGVR